jgi:hypothetical protein
MMGKVLLRRRISDDGKGAPLRKPAAPVLDSQLKSKLKV